MSPADAVVDPVPSEAPGLQRLVWTYLAEQARVIIDAEPALRDHGLAEDADELVHDTRVAVRRFRSTLRVFADLFDEPDAEQTGETLRWWAGVLGVVRDLEVLGERLGAHLDELEPELVLGPVRRDIVETLQLRRNAGWDEIVATLDVERYRQLVADVRRWRSDPPFTAVADQPEKAVRGYVKRAKKKVDKRLSLALKAHQHGDPEADHLFHQARKAGKRHRYALELALPVLGSKAEDKIADRKQLQDILGDHQDGTVAAAFLRAEGARLGSRSGRNGFTYGVLYARELQSAQSVPDRLS